MLKSLLAAGMCALALVSCAKSDQGTAIEETGSAGARSVDETFGGEAGPGISFDRRHWPHGASGTAEVHAALFRR